MMSRHSALVVKLDADPERPGPGGELVDTYSARQGGPLLSGSGNSSTPANAAGRMVMNLLTVISQWELVRPSASAPRL